MINSEFNYVACHERTKDGNTFAILSIDEAKTKSFTNMLMINLEDGEYEDLSDLAEFDAKQFAGLVAGLFLESWYDVFNNTSVFYG